MKNKKIILVITIIMILFAIMGTTYSLLSYVKVGNQNYVAITGDIYMKYLTGNQINITNCVPMSKEEALATNDNVFNFQIVGKNTSNKDIYFIDAYSHTYANEDRARIFESFCSTEDIFSKYPNLKKKAFYLKDEITRVYPSIKDSKLFNILN